MNVVNQIQTNLPQSLLYGLPNVGVDQGAAYARVLARQPAAS
ncbi:conserved hypothetical protein [Burkholderia pseudomallei 1106b]|uniref:Uncharacterized protein n=2 Tax=Burkholderia pseudomallei TaxID=28450 RepID=A0A0E1W3G1_BURPE|nr:conserved hypothetical protein [Burkholderia pseudomallei 1106a]EEC35748.1 conserved hypothetical protein [Burkholderia pseudomallei 576]EEH23855.1 conserved hypothetical protein [Burkholderia pseudomallei Pakistan 9]EES24907.1 conserved hypothetical protein [Burkholderia pseudomallei 1106b]EET07678.1 conserved hypothetical protein [Burkholderia pseudomallei 1710a]